MTNILIHFSIFIIIAAIKLINEASCTNIDDPLTFTRTSEWAVRFELSEEDDECIAYRTYEVRKKLCYYAKLQSRVSYLDYDYLPYWHLYDVTTYIPEFHFGMYCATVPRIRVLLHCEQTNLEIRVIRHDVHSFEFNADVIKAKFVSANKKMDIEEPKTEIERLNQIGAVGRVHLCLHARDYLPATSTLNFLHHDAPEAKLYDFEDEGESDSKIYPAISCPTVPKLYLRAETSYKNLRIVLLHGLIDDYQFEVEEIKPVSVTKISEERKRMVTEFPGNRLLQLKTDDRFDLCSMARRHEVFSHVPFVSDDNVTGARVYAFEYQGEVVKRHVAIQCMAVPSMYLREDESSEGTKKIKIIFVETIADSYVYNVEIVQSLNIVTKDVEEEGESQPILDFVPEDHPFKVLNEESRWSLCWRAQKHILNDPENRWKFRFANLDNLLSDFKLLLIPDYMQNPQVYELNYASGESEQDTIIQCSEWPKMYVRLGDSSKEIKIVLQEIRYLVK